MRLNEMFIFPFEKIKKGADIIIYGLGSVGRCFYNQAVGLKYCNVVAIADQYGDKYEDVRYTVILPEQIPQYDYDYVLIAVASEAVARQIKNELTDKWKISKEKIVFAGNRKIPVHLADTNLKELLKSEDILSRELSAFLVTKDGDINYFSNIINEMFKLQAGHETEKVNDIKAYFKNFLKKEESIKNQIVILRLLYAAGYFDAELLEIYINNIPKIKNYDSRMWLLYDISVIERNEQSYRYQNFYLDKRRVMEENVFHYFNTASFSPLGRKRNHRVAIITFSLGDNTSSHNALIVPYANEMVNQGKEVVIFPVDLFRYRYGECFIQPIEPLEQRAVNYSDVHKELFNPKIQIAYNNGEDMEERIFDIISGLCNFSPEVVFDFCGEYSFVSPIIKKMFPVIAIPMRGYASSACFDVYMCRNKAICLKENEYYQSIREEQMVEGLVCTLPQKANKAYSRKDFGIKTDAFIITTVGNRLKTELTPDFVDCVCNFIRENQRACWILVGGKICDYIRERYSDYLSDGKIVEWGYEEDLIGFYNICDIYWNPNRMGAGGSIGSAMRCGLPVVTTNFPSDVLPRLGMENAINGNYEDCKEYVKKLYDNPRLYKEKSELMKERMKISGVPQYVAQLLEVGEKLYLQRGASDES